MIRECIYEEQVLYFLLKLYLIVCGFYVTRENLAGIIQV